MIDSKRNVLQTNNSESAQIQGIPNDSESDLLVAATRGNHAAFGELCQRHSAHILRVVKRIARNNEDAEDALQEATLKAFTYLPQFDGRSRFSTWFTRIAINEALMILRKDRVRRGVSINVAGEFSTDRFCQDIADPAPAIDMMFAAHEKIAAVKKAIHQLRPSLRTVIEIRCLRECSMEETALALGVSLAAAKGRLFHSRAQLRKRMIPEDSFCSHQSIVYQGRLSRRERRRNSESRCHGIHRKLSRSQEKEGGAITVGESACKDSHVHGCRSVTNENLPDLRSPRRPPGFRIQVLEQHKGEIL